MSYKAVSSSVDIFSLSAGTGLVSVIVLPPLEGAVYGAMGALVSALSMFLVLLQSTEKVPQPVWLRTLGQAIFAMIIGVISAYTIGDVVASFLHMGNKSVDIAAFQRFVQFALGLASWRLASVVTNKIAEKIGGL